MADYEEDRERFRYFITRFASRRLTLDDILQLEPVEAAEIVAELDYFDNVEYYSANEKDTDYHKPNKKGIDILLEDAELIDGMGSSLSENYAELKESISQYLKDSIGWFMKNARRLKKAVGSGKRDYYSAGYDISKSVIAILERDPENSYISAFMPRGKRKDKMIESMRRIILRYESESKDTDKTRTSISDSDHNLYHSSEKSRIVQNSPSRSITPYPPRLPIPNTGYFHRENPPYRENISLKRLMILDRSDTPA